MKLVPIADKVILKGVEAEEKTKSGIVIPGQAKAPTFSEAGASLCKDWRTL